MSAQISKTRIVPEAPMNDVSYEEHIVAIKCLPKRMRSLPMVKTVLEQVGIDGDMTGCQSDKNHRIIVSFKSARSALVCVKHFNGRLWSGPAAPPVVAEMLSSSTDHCNAVPKTERHVASMSLKEIIKQNPPPASFRAPPGLSLDHGQPFPRKPLLATYPGRIVQARAPKQTAHFSSLGYDDDDSTDAGSSHGWDAEVSIFL